MGLEDAHLAAAGPLVEALVTGGDEVRICFDARELTAVPEGSAVVLLNAARDADWLNLARPVVSERQLRLFVWLQPGDLRTLRERAPDFLDWMQQSVEVPPSLPGYAAAALGRALGGGESIAWIGPGLRELLPATVSTLDRSTGDSEAAAAMSAGPVVVRGLARAADLDRFVEAYDAAGTGLGIVWDEPPAVAEGATLVVAEPMEWEEAARWLAEAGVAEPRLEAARRDLDPVMIASLGGRPVPWQPPAAPDAVATVEERPPANEKPRDRWQRAYQVFDPFEPQRDPALRARRPPRCPGPERIRQELVRPWRGRTHLLAGGPGSGTSTELHALAEAICPQRPVVLLDLREHFARTVGDPSALRNLQAWELVGLLGLAGLRLGRERNGYVSRRGQRRLAVSLSRLIERAPDPDIDVGRLASALGGVTVAAPAGGPSVVARAVGASLPTGKWNWPLGSPGAPVRSGRDPAIAALFKSVVDIFVDLEDELGDPVVVFMDGLNQVSHLDSRMHAVLRELDSLPGHVVLSWPLRLRRFERLGWRGTFTRLDDLGLADSHGPASLRLEVGFFRELLDLRLGAIGLDGGLFPGALVERLAWASGGRPRDFVRLVADLAEAACAQRDAPLVDLAEQVIADHRRMLGRGLTREGYDLLASLVDDPAGGPPADELAGELFDLGLIRVFPSPGGTCYLPHPLLIPSLRRQGG